MPYEYITKHDSPAFTKAADVPGVFGRPRKVTSITIHHWGRDGQAFDAPLSWLTRADADTSAHYIAEAGRVACIVDPDDAAWHAGSAEGNATSIGIECRPEARDGDYETVAELIRDLRGTYGDLPLIPHKQWKATSCPGRWDLARLDALARKEPKPGTSAAGKRAAEMLAYAGTVLGKSIDVDGYPPRQPYQCVDLVKHSAHHMHGAPLQAYGNGKDVAWNLSRLPGWKWIPGTERGQAGDYASWDDPYGVKEILEDGMKKRVVYGHTGALMTDDDGGELDVLQADGFTSGAKVYRGKNSRRGLRGFARPPRYVAPELAAPNVGAGADSYVIRQGDTYWSLSLQLGTTVARLRELNPDVNEDALKVGQRIRVKGTTGGTTTVRAGEGPWQVAQRSGISLARFYELNGEKALHPGDVVKVSA